MMIFIFALFDMVSFCICSARARGIATFLCFALFAPGILRAQTSPEIVIVWQDASVQRGGEARIPIRALIRQAPASWDSLSITIRFAPAALAFRRSFGGGANLMQCESPRVDTQFVNLNIAAARLSCSSLLNAPLSSDTITLATIEFQTLASADLTTTIVVDSLSVNGRLVLPASASRPAQITLQGAPLVIGQFPDAIGQNFPSPVTAAGASFPYTVAEAGRVEFALLSVRGETLAEYPPVIQRQGRYIFEFAPTTPLSAGAYFLRMTTMRGVYYRKFLFTR
jgi:hypothetical protein